MSDFHGGPVPPQQPGSAQNQEFDPQHPERGWQPAQQHPRKSPKKPRKWLPYAIPAGTFVLGLAIGAAPSNSATSAAEYASAHPVVTKTVTPPPVVKTVEVVPATCKTALDDADLVIATAGQGFNIVAEAMGAASEFDVDGITAATEKLTTLNKEKLTPQLEAYKTARDECQS